MYRSRDPRSDLDEFVCPRCRFPVVVPLGETPRWPACPKDGWPLVARETFLKCDGDPLLGARVEGGFVPIAVAGSGATSTVYKATRDAGGFAAVKVLRLDGPQGERVIDAWQREVSALEGLEAPGVPRMLDTGRVTQPPAFFVALEWVDGEPLSGSDDPFPLERALGVVSAIARAAAELHARGVVHGDLNPSNVLVDGDLLSVIDLGSSCAEGQRLPAFEDENYAGSPAYAAPELLDGAPVNRRSDLYAIGCVLYRLLTGRLPFWGTPANLVHGHRSVTPARPSELVEGIPCEVDELVLGLLEKERARRPASAGVLLGRLAQLGVPLGSVRGPKSGRGEPQ